MNAVTPVFIKMHGIFELTEKLFLPQHRYSGVLNPSSCKWLPYKQPIITIIYNFSKNELWTSAMCDPRGSGDHICRSLPWPCDLSPRLCFGVYSDQDSHIGALLLELFISARIVTVHEDEWSQFQTLQRSTSNEGEGASPRTADWTLPWLLTFILTSLVRLSHIFKRSIDHTLQDTQETMPLAHCCR